MLPRQLMSPVKAVAGKWELPRYGAPFGAQGWASEGQSDGCR